MQRLILGRLAVVPQLIHTRLLRGILSSMSSPSLGHESETSHAAVQSAVRNALEEAEQKLGSLLKETASVRERVRDLRRLEKGLAVLGINSPRDSNALSSASEPIKIQNSPSNGTQHVVTGMLGDESQILELRRA